MTHVSDDERYRWLNDVVRAVYGEDTPPLLDAVRLEP